MKLKGTKNVYEEIAERYRQYIAFGVVKDGEKLPSCRELAMELGINPNTVERAYSLLEEQGLVVTVPKKGTFARAAIDKKAQLLSEAQGQIAAMKNSGIKKQQLLEIIERVYKEDRL